MELRQTGSVFHGLKSGVSKSRFKFQAIAICAALMNFATTGWGQSNPTAYNLSLGSFSFTGFADNASTSYPASMQGWRFSAEPTSATAGPAAADFVLSANSGGVATGSIRNEGTSGISILNSGSNNLGAIALSLNTTGRTSILVTWTAADMTSSAGRVNAVVLQYRVGTTGNFTDVASTTYTSNGTSAAVAQTFSSIALPAAAQNQSVVQIRWLYYAVSGTGSRDRIRIDDITVSSSAGATPTITASGTLSAVSTTYGTASASPASFTVFGANMSAGIAVTPPAGFEVSTSSTFASDVGSNASPITVGSSGTIASTTVYVRLAATASVGSSPYSGNIVLTSSGASNVNVATASSTVTAKGLTITGLSAANKNWDGTTTVSVTGTPAYSGLVNGETFSVTGTVTWAFPDANVGTNKTLTRTGSFNTTSSNYTVTQPTLTANIAAVAPEAPTITGITAGNSQLSVAFTAGADGGSAITNYKYSIDGGTLVSVGSTSSPFIITGLTNNQSYAVRLYAVNTAGDSVASLAANGTPLAPSSPTITVAPATFGSAFSTTYGTASSTQTFAVSGSTLSSDLTVTAPTGTEISLSSGSGYAGSLVLPQTSGAVSSTTIYARLKATASAGSYNGQSFSVSSSGATTQNVAKTATGNVVGQAALTIIGIGIANKVYDRATTATITGTATYGGLQNGESFGVTGTPSASFATATVGLAKPVTVTGYTAPNSNYTLIQPTLAADISAVALTVTGATVNPKSYDGNTVATITGATLSGVISPDVVTLTGGTSGAFANANVGTGIAVSTTMGITGADAGNYSFTAPTGLVGEITKATAAITFASLPSGKKAGDSAFSAGATTTAGTLSYSSSNPNVATVDGSGNITPVAPGVTTITASVAGTSNYNAAVPASQTLNVGSAGGGGQYSVDFEGASETKTAYTSGSVTLSGISWNMTDALIGTLAGSDYFVGVRSARLRGFTTSSMTMQANKSNGAGTVSFKYRQYGSDAQVSWKVEYSTDQGANWTQAGTFTATSTAQDFSATVNVSGNVRFRIVHNSGGDTSTNKRANVDNFVVTDYPSAGAPAITRNGSFSALTTTYGTASGSSATTVSVTGGSLTAGIVATAPTGFEVSNDGATYGATATFAQSGGFANGTLYLRLAANAAAGVYDNQVVTLTSTGASNQTVAIASSTVSAGSLAGGDIALTPVGDGSYTASGPVGSTFSYSYAGRSANGITTSYSSASAPTVAGYYTVTATATGNYSGSNTVDYFVAGPVAVSDAITKPAGNPSLVLTLASLLANDVRITPAGAVATDGLSITGVTNGSGNSAQIDGGDILFTPGGASPETFTYTLGYGIQTAIGTVTVITESSAPTFTLAIVKLGTAVYSAPNTEVTHDFIGVPNQTYAVEYSTDLTNWTNAGNRSTGATGSFSLNITNSGDVAADWNAHMFFRARLVR
jgi:hypothetical protein